MSLPKKAKKVEPEGTPYVLEMKQYDGASHVLNFKVEVRQGAKLLPFLGASYNLNTKVVSVWFTEAQKFDGWDKAMQDMTLIMSNLREMAHAVQKGGK